MIKFKILLIAIAFMFTACNSPSSSSTRMLKSEVKICPMCNMEIAKSNAHSSSLAQGGTVHYFDDIGCMVLWANKNQTDTDKAKVFSNDTKRYIDAAGASFRIGEKTPMSYGFSAYENKVENQIDFDEVAMKILRGEHMANPKIRKQIMGY